MGLCPICGIEGAEQRGRLANRDAYVYDCPRCGHYAVDALFQLAPEQAANRHLLSAALRAASDAKQHLTLDQDDIDTLIASVPRPNTLFEAVDRLLLFLAARVTDYWSKATFNKDTDYPLIVARDAEQMNHLLVTAGDLGFFDIHKSVFTIDGWRRVEELRSTRPRTRQAFVAMSFADDLTPTWTDGFKKGIEDSNYFSAYRVDSFEHNGRIDDRIIAEIRRSSLVVADFTGQRGGVYFEAGLALGLGVPVIWTCREDDAAGLHFDTRQYNHILWNSAVHLRSRLDQRIRATVLPPRA